MGYGLDEEIREADREEGRDSTRRRESRGDDGGERSYAGERELREAGTNAGLPHDYHDRREDNDGGEYGLVAEAERDRQGSASTGAQEPPRGGRSAGGRRRGGASDAAGTAASRFMKALYNDSHQYIRMLGPLSANARPSSLQSLVKRKKHLLSSSVKPTLGAGGLHFQDLHVDPATRQLQPINVPSFYMSLVQASGVPGSGVQDREPFLRLGRVCLFSGAQYLSDLSVLSNVQVASVKKAELGRDGLYTWSFDPSMAYTLLVRSNVDAPKLKIFIELNVSYHVTAQEVQALPHHLRKKAAQVDEVTVAWATIPFKHAVEAAHARKDFHVSLCVGPLSAPRRVADVVAAAMEQKSFLSKMLTRESSPILTLRISALKPEEAAASAFLPPTIVCTPRFTPFITMYRKVLADRLLNHGSFMQPVAEPILQIFPKVLDDADMTYAFLALWQKQSSTSGPPSTVQQSVEMFRLVCLQIWPLMHMGAVHPASISNDALHQRARSKSIVQFVSKHPHETCTAVPNGWMHRPFDTSEMAYRYE